MLLVTVGQKAASQAGVITFVTLNPLMHRGDDQNARKFTSSAMSGASKLRQDYRPSEMRDNPVCHPTSARTEPVLIGKRSSQPKRWSALLPDSDDDVLPISPRVGSLVAKKIATATNKAAVPPKPRRAARLRGMVSNSNSNPSTTIPTKMPAVPANARNNIRNYTKSSAIGSKSRQGRY